MHTHTNTYLDRCGRQFKSEMRSSDSFLSFFFLSCMETWRRAPQIGIKLRMEISHRVLTWRSALHVSALVTVPAPALPCHTKHTLFCDILVTFALEAWLFQSWGGEWISRAKVGWLVVAAWSRIRAQWESIMIDHRCLPHMGEGTGERESACCQPSSRCCSRQVFWDGKQKSLCPSVEDTSTRYLQNVSMHK